MSECDDVQYTDNSDRWPGRATCGHCGYDLDTCECHIEHGPECECKNCVYYFMQDCPECGHEFFPGGPTPITAHPEGGCQSKYPPCGCTHSRPAGWWRK